jgi:hypothetical protein
MKQSQTSFVSLEIGQRNLSCFSSSGSQKTIHCWITLGSKKAAPIVYSLIFSKRTYMYSN